MVSLKTSLTVAALGLVNLASARQCTARITDSVNAPIGGASIHHHKIEVWFNDNPDEILDSQESGLSPGQMKHLDIYDGVQTLTSDALGGDVCLWATRSETRTSGLTRHIGSCSGEYMDQKNLQGTVNGNGWNCDIVLGCYMYQALLNYNMT